MNTATQGEHSGSDVNYYQLYVEKSAFCFTPYWIECEDVIATFNMSFAEGTVLKSLWRSCAERTLGKLKRGGDSIRDAEKMVYYSKEIIRRARMNITSEQIIDKGYLPVPGGSVYIKYPKRNPQCTAYRDDIATALGMTSDEASCLKFLWTLVFTRDICSGEELPERFYSYGNSMLFHAESVLQYRKQQAVERAHAETKHSEGHAEEDGFNTTPLKPNSGVLIMTADSAVTIATEIPAFLQKQKDL